MQQDASNVQVESLCPSDHGPMLGQRLAYPIVSLIFQACGELVAFSFS